MQLLVNTANYTIVPDLYKFSPTFWAICSRTCLGWPTSCMSNISVPLNCCFSINWSSIDNYHLCWAERVVIQDRFYCSKVDLCNLSTARSSFYFQITNLKSRISNQETDEKVGLLIISPLRVIASICRLIHARTHAQTVLCIPAIFWWIGSLHVLGMHTKLIQCHEWNRY